MYSGPCAAWGYAALAADGKPGSVVIVSPNHRGIGAAVALAGASQWETPLGTVHGDLDLTEAIVAACPEARIDDSAHREEHAVEVQLPFLQYLYGDTVHVAAIALSDYRWATVRALGDGIATACRDRDVVIIASTDLSHYVPQERAERQDALILDRIREMDGERLLRAAIERHVSMCGAGPVAAMLQSARALGMDAAKILRYYTSGDIVGASDEVVGYASAVIHARRG
jgi:AmmeMemoRadiSam system protein B